MNAYLCFSCLSLLMINRLAWQQITLISFQFLLRFVQYMGSQHVYLFSHSSHLTLFFSVSSAILLTFVFIQYPILYCFHMMHHTVSHPLFLIFFCLIALGLLQNIILFIPCFHNYSLGLYSAMPSVSVT